MGAGNPLIRSFDTDRYQPTTYFIDFTKCYDLEEWIKEELIEREDERIFEDLSEEDKYDMLNIQLEFDIDYIRDEYFLIEEFFNNKYFLPNKNKRYIEELSAEYRGGASVIVESDDAYIVTTTDSEYSHFAIGIVPKFKYDELEEEIDYEQESKFDWYVARDREQDYYNKVKSLAEKLYNKKLKLFLKTHEPTMRKIHEHHMEEMSCRNGAWCSTPLKTIGKDFKFL